ncbi:MAG TPA: outer membrane lipoprotein chaperone LolA [Xanthomonadaceae bacterium]|nr:outer membrane lipoprotein chaperone LolA [Xanthomonadaceae bacterium]
MLKSRSARTPFRRAGGLALFCVLLAGLATGSVHADALPQLRAFTDGLESVQGSFVQRVFDANERIVEQSRGELAMARPNLFRWQYSDPFEQLIVADGERVWIYDPDLEQVTVRAQSASEAQSPLSVLLDPAGIESHYLLQELGESEDAWWLRLLPREEEPEFRYADLVFKDNELRAMHLHDSLGQRNVLLFGDWSRNPELPADTFRFEPPPGVDIIGAEEH